MKRIRILALAAMASIVACTDNAGSALTGPSDSPPPPPPPSLSTIAGRISVIGSGSDRVIELRDASDNVFRLVGSEAAALASVDGADVIARGTFDANPGFVVDEFQVTAMNGRPALDGVLEASEDGFAIRLADGSHRAVSGLSAECAIHLGSRVWVTGWEKAEAIQFGVIAAV